MATVLTVPTSMTPSASSSTQSTDEHAADRRTQLLALLPASYRTEHGDVAATGRRVLACVEQQLDLRRLTAVHRWLWLAGRPMPPRPLHHQLVLGREIVLTEQMDMHLVWRAGKMFLKPVPRFLLEPTFWTEWLSCDGGCCCTGDKTVASHAGAPGCRRALRGRALGFLFSYAALISHESDFHVAKETRLLQQEVSWPAWRTLVEQLETEHIYPHVDARFHYGELRLSRLDKIYRVRTSLARGYMPRWRRYHDFWRDHLALLAASTVYMAIVLTAMQVGLATELAGSDTFQAASYGFTVFSILGPLIAMACIVLRFVAILVYNLVVTVGYKKGRVARIDGQDVGL
ncbi:hypothetical protein ACRE_043120 [Hapsidospora chrysogenum ATCC 11550]|uniref:Uncharacterized protein n=1 Tax=Hapsidospora chrysogenum (strain ATCC 11550 / CBS 779.69 / DSM 880 / IAM 14645 / JCM 23072 / IMI 49137) TaxID=857340 RepID=A0A086T6A9_HAPC1|nr:hypothetical protein ACRE_043120 [Hapsidospora chrysogenum ATCC 11550]